MLILLVMPVVMIILFGYAITTEVKNTRVAVFDLTKSEETRRIVDAFDANRYFTVVGEVGSMDEVDGLFKHSQIDMVLCFSADFGAAAPDGSTVQMLFDGIEPNQAQLRSGYALQVMAQIPQAAPGIRVSTRMLYNPQQRSEYNFVPGVIGMIILLLCTLMTSIAIVREKENGTMEVLLASPLPPMVIILSKLVPYFLISIVNLATILLLSQHLLSIPMAGSMVAFCGVALIYILVALALGLLISTCVSSQLAAMLLSLLLIVPTIYFSGMVFAIESMPQPVQVVSTIVPARWFIDAARKLMIQGVEPAYVAKDAAILVVDFIVLMGVALKLFKIRLE
ncbi:MAG: ABC transporter permease [Prevotella sp.]|nr:ABC transporter permease [Prevotella sp.]